MTHSVAYLEAQRQDGDYVCPYCRKVFEFHYPIAEEGKERVGSFFALPGKDDVGICDACKNAFVFTEAGTRTATPEDLPEIKKLLKGVMERS